MPRIKRAVHKKKRKRKIFKAVKGFWGRRKSAYRTAREAMMKAMAYATRDRKVKARTFRRLWITRVSAACRVEGISYSNFIQALDKGKVKINRKMLAQVAVQDPSGFEFLVKEVKNTAAEETSGGAA